MYYICNMPTITKRNTGRKQEHQGRSFYHAGYQTQEWRAIRRQVLQHEPLCRDCKANGIIKTANVIDHIKPVRLGGEFWETTNMQPLCTSCHNRKSAYESKGINPVGGKFSTQDDRKTAGHSFSHPCITE